MQPVGDVFWRHWPLGLTRRWSVIKTWKRLALASGKLLCVLVPGKAWAYALSKQTPHCNFPSLKSAICTHLTRRYNATQTSKHLKMRLLPICQMYVAQWSQGGAEMKLEDAILSNFVRRFFRLKFAPLRTKGCQLSMLARWKRADCQSLSLPGLSNLSKKIW